MSSRLDVSLYGTPVGFLERAGRSGNTVSFTPSDEGVARFGVGSLMLSDSLPLYPRANPDNADTALFFDGLLPEGSARDVLRAKAIRTARSTADVFGLLAYNGGNVAGAVTVGSRDFNPKYVTLTDAEYRYAVLNPNEFLTDLAGGNSLGGFQGKITLHRNPQGEWEKAVDGATTTHILKPAVTAERFEPIANEAYNISLARHIGLLDYDSWVEDVGDIKVLVIERYDREVMADNSVRRIHQENAAQALGAAIAAKSHYQVHNKDATLANIAGLMKRQMRGSEYDNEHGDLARLAQYTIFSTIVGNTDGHMRNHGLVKEADGRVYLAPLYDVPAAVVDRTKLSGDMGNPEMALYIGGQKGWRAITSHRLISEFVSWGVSGELASYLVSKTCLDISAAMEETAEVEGMSPKLKAFIQNSTQNIMLGRGAGYGAEDARFSANAISVIPLAAAPSPRTSRSALCGYMLPRGGLCTRPAGHNGVHRHN